MHAGSTAVNQRSQSLKITACCASESPCVRSDCGHSVMDTLVERRMCAWLLLRRLLARALAPSSLSKDATTPMARLAAASCVYTNSTGSGRVDVTHVGPAPMKNKMPVPTASRAASPLPSSNFHMPARSGANGGMFWKEVEATMAGLLARVQSRSSSTSPTNSDTVPCPRTDSPAIQAPRTTWPPDCSAPVPTNTVATLPATSAPCWCSHTSAVPCRRDHTSVSWCHSSRVQVRSVA